VDVFETLAGKNHKEAWMKATWSVDGEALKQQS
jgi:hypothetical protein